MDKIKPLFTSIANVVGGRNGHGETTDGSVKVDLSIPKEMGGPGKPGTTTPEALFATGYAACFGSSLDLVAQKKLKKDGTNAKVTCAVSIGHREGGGGFALAVKLHIEDMSLPQADLEAIVKEAHENVCPYSRAINGNVEVTLEVVGS